MLRRIHVLYNCSTCTSSIMLSASPFEVWSARDVSVSTQSAMLVMPLLLLMLLLMLLLRRRWRRRDARRLVPSPRAEQRRRHRRLHCPLQRLQRLRHLLPLLRQLLLHRRLLRDVD